MLRKRPRFSGRRRASRFWGPLLVAGAALALAYGLDQASLWLRPSKTGMARAVDGDSLELEGRSIRLTGLDAPELAQTCLADGKPYPCGRQARSVLASIADKAPLDCRIAGQDRFGRDLAQCFAGGTDIAAELVRLGWALADGDYEREQAQARAAAAGIWRGTFQPPADWRRDNPRPPSE